MTKTVIELDNVSKLYRRTTPGHQLRTLKSALLERSLISDLKAADIIEALVDVSLTVDEGEAVGLIGSNGSGKSTALKLLAGIIKPSRGSISVRGKIAALIELGAGFHPEISGRENIYINASILGLTRSEIDAQFQNIVEFSGLADFIDEPVKFYSSGMYVRLGFSVAIHTNPDILIVDEVLAVGDEAFSHRCLARIEEFLAEGKTLLLVSHSLSLIEDLCDRVVWLEQGRLKLEGSPRRVIDAYRESVAKAEGRAHRSAKESREGLPAREDGSADPAGEEGEPLRWGTREAQIQGVRLLVDEREQYHFNSGAAVRFEISIESRQTLSDFVFGIAISTPRGVECWGTNTDLEGFEPSRLLAGSSVVSIQCARLELGAGEYLVDVAVHTKDGAPYDYRRRLMRFSVTSVGSGVGLYLPEHEWSFAGQIEWKSERKAVSSSTADR